MDLNNPIPIRLEEMDVRRTNIRTLGDLLLVPKNEVADVATRVTPPISTSMTPIMEIVLTWNNSICLLTCFGGSGFA